MNIAYSCLGRAWNLDPQRASTLGGDMDRIRLLQRLAWEHPEHTFVLVGRNSGEDLSDLGYPTNVVNPWSHFKMPTLPYEQIGNSRDRMMEWLVRSWRPILRELPLCGRHIMWAGQHGGSNSPLPMIDTDWEDNKLTKPQMAFMNYCAYLLDYCNVTTIEPLVICPDPRNYWKARELMAPLTRPVLAQYDMVRTTKWEQFGNWAKGTEHQTRRDRVPGVREKSVYVTQLPYTYAAIEMTALDDPRDIPWNHTPPATAFGIVSNENRKEVNPSRFDLVRQIRTALGPFRLYGSWSPENAKTLDETGVGPCLPVPATEMYGTLHQFRSTVTLPASGSGWATAKPWECFAAGVVCFFYGKYDEQGHIMPTQAQPPGLGDRRAVLRNTLWPFLRVSSPEELRVKVAEVATKDNLWRDITEMQREYFELSFEHHRGGARAVEEALAL